MRLGPLLALLAAVVLGVPRATAQDAGPAFASSLPDGVGDVSGWELVTGEFETATARGSYRFYVNPARRAMYQLMRYRVDILEPWPAVRERRGDAERVAFVRLPGSREPMLFWARGSAGTDPEWRAIASDKDEYRAELGVLMAVLGVHRAARASQP
jgi:hypothetical protein